MAPNPQSAAAAVETLRAELDTAISSLESIDRKATLIPAVLGTVAGIFIAPSATFRGSQAAVLIAAVLTGVIAVFFALRVIWARYVNIGPNARQTASGTYLDPAAFNHAVAGSLATAIDQLSAVSAWKGHRLNLHLVGSRDNLLARSRTNTRRHDLSDKDTPGTTPDAPLQPQAPQALQQSTPPQEPPPPQPEPPANFGTQEAMRGEQPASFGQQIMTKGGLPQDLETSIHKIETKE